MKVKSFTMKEASVIKKFTMNNPTSFVFVCVYISSAETRWRITSSAIMFSRNLIKALRPRWGRDRAISGTGSAPSGWVL